MIRLYRPDVRRCPADRAIHAHRTDVRKALIELFQNPVSQASDVARKVLTRVLCKQDIAFDRPILDFKMDRHMAAMAKLRPDILDPVVWESCKSADQKTVLQNFRDEGQEHVAFFLGKFHSPCSRVAYIGLVPGWI
jgi:hypothetical protein